MKNLNATVENLNNLLDGNGARAYGAAGHVVVFDGATGAIYTADDAQTLAERWAEGLEEQDEYQRGQAYSLACSAVSAFHESQVPAEVAQALREESGHEDLTWGW